MEVADVTLAARGQVVIPKEARDALGLKPGVRLSVRVEGSRLLLEKRVTLNLSRWIGKAVDDGLSTEQALTELRARPVPWSAETAKAKPVSLSTAHTAATALGPVRRGATLKIKPPRK